MISKEERRSVSSILEGEENNIEKELLVFLTRHQWLSSIHHWQKLTEYQSFCSSIRPIFLHIHFFLLGKVLQEEQKYTVYDQKKEIKLTRNGSQDCHCYYWERKEERRKKETKGDFLEPESFIKTFLFCIGVQPINNVVILSGEQQRDSAIHIHALVLPHLERSDSIAKNTQFPCMHVLISLSKKKKRSFKVSVPKIP